MQICRFVLAFVASLMLTTGTALAQTVGETTFGGGVSVFGATLESTYRIEPDLRLRGVFMGGLSFDATDEDDDGNRYEADINLAAAAFLVDYYPYASGWRLSGGLLMDFSDITAEGSGGPGEPFEINGETFVGGDVSGEAMLANPLAPMVTAGYDHDLGNGWILSGEIGAVYTGGFETEYTANSDALQAAIDDDPDFQDALDEAEGIDILPYLSVSVSFRF